MKPILEVHHLAKKYKIRHLSGGYLSLRERMLGAFKFGNSDVEDFWAVNDVSFEVQPGESIGIIGRNGAGKSTLLKILSKITPPTKGKIISRGRMASLLEVGTGFHPELTGRENIFFNGSLLGMKRKEIEAKFDEIIDFSGVEKFLDTPLKHYSSGMQLRLAFSVAAFLEPEILVIDEVLAVGDAEFQKKCLGKMEDVSKSGRTILFVSHQLGMLGQLCKQSIILDKGKIIQYGESHEIINSYIQSLKNTNDYSAREISSDKIFAIIKVRAINQTDESVSNFAHSDTIKLHISFFARQQLHNTHLCVSVNNRNGQRIFSSDQLIQNYQLGEDNINHAYWTIPKETLTPGDYSFFVAIHCPNVMGYDVKDQLCPISIYDNGSNFIQYENKWFYGDVFVKTDWNFKFYNNAFK